MAYTKDYNEIWLEAMRTVAESVVSGIEFDRTVKCQIIKKKNAGIYLVRESDTLIYEATIANGSDVDQYEVDEWVYVLIPGGNFSNTKLIVGKYMRDTSESALGYVPPLGSMLDMTDNILEDDASPYLSNKPTGGLRANGYQVQNFFPLENLQVKSLLTDENGNDTVLHLSGLDEDIVHNHIYDTFGVKASFKTMFGGVDMISGSYGLMVYLYRTDAEPVALRLDSSDMFGNPYNYMAYFTQSKKFDISNIGKIDAIGIYMYQGDNFYYNDGENDLIFNALNDGQPKPPNILVKDVYVSFGQDLAKIEDNTFKLSTYGDAGAEMNYNASDISDNTRTIYATWYNKSEFDEFIGFSDGVIDTGYDEAYYAQQFEEQMAGASLGAVEGVPKLKESLQIYANAQKIERNLDSLHIRISRDIMGLIPNLSEYLNAYGLSTQKILSDNLYSKFEEYLEKIILVYDNLDNEENEKSAWDYYIEYLEKALEVYNAIKEDSEVPSLSNTGVKTTVPGLIRELNNEWGVKSENLVARINALFTSIESLDRPDIMTYVNRCKQEFEQYIEIINSIFESLENLLVKTDEQITNFESRLANKDLTTFEEEYKAFEEQYKNKYCIYWYRKDLTAEGDHWSGEGWSKITFPSLMETPGMPAIDTEVTPNVYFKRSSLTYTPTLNVDLAKDCFKAILFFNHVAHESNVLEFENSRPPDGSGDMSDIAGALYIEHGLNSSDTYQKYNSSFGLVSASDGMINRELIVRFDGVEQKDEALIGSTVYWYVPKSHTMLTYDAIRLAEEGFTNLANIPVDTQDPYQQEYLSHKKDKYECFFKGIRDSGAEVDPPVPMSTDVKFYYMIAKQYSAAYSQNEIICLVSANGHEYEASKVFSFSTYGTSGTDFTLSIVPMGTQYAIEDIADSVNPLEVKAKFSGYNGAEVENPPAITYGWYGVTNSVPPHVEVISDDELEELEIEKETGAIYYRVGKDFDPANNELYYVLQCQASWDKINEETESDQTLQLVSYYPVPYSFGPYYMDGTTTVVYNSSGSKASYANTPYKLFYIHSGEEYIPFDSSTNSDRPLRWQLRHFKSDGKLHHITECDQTSRAYKYWDENGDLITDPDDIEEIAKIDSYLPKMKYSTYDDLGNVNRIQGYHLSPVTMYVESKGDVQLYSVAVAIEETFNGTGYDEKMVFAQPIWIGQNQWESAMLNSWDESLTIDEKNGTILSSMVGAGYKDEQNRFHGVLMGNVEKADLEFGNKQGVGLYGFHEGAQSFCWNVDGTGFIGKSGRGRIEFDGNKGIIRSSSFNMTNGSAGTEIDLDDGKITLRGAQLTRIDPDDENSAIVKCEKGSNSLIQLNVISPYFKVNSKDGNTLILIGDDKMHIQTNTYDPDTYTGVKFDLMNSRLDAYDFKLNALSLDEGKLSGVIIDSTSPYLRVLNPNSTPDNKTYILEISKNKYEMKSVDYSSSNSTGLMIDLKDGAIKGYDFLLKAIHPILTTYSVVIDSGAGSDATAETINNYYPLKIGKTSDPAFKVSWGGLVKATGADISGTISASKGDIGGWLIDGTTLKSKNGNIILDSLAGTIWCGTPSETGGTRYVYVNGSGRFSGLYSYIDHLGIGTTLNMYGKCYIGTEYPITDSATVEAKSTLINALTEQLTIAGAVKVTKDIIMNGRIYSVTTAGTAAANSGTGTPTSYIDFNNYGYGTAHPSAPAVALHGSYALIYASKIWLGDDATDKIYMNGIAHFNSPNTILVTNAAPVIDEDDTDGDGYINLPSYIKKHSGSLFNISFVTNNNVTQLSFGGSAEALHTGGVLGIGATRTLVAPTAVGSAGQFLKATNAAGGTEWTTINQVPGYNSSNAGQFLKVVYVPSSGNYITQWATIDTSVDWSEISNIPASFTPSAHAHSTLSLTYKTSTANAIVTTPNEAATANSMYRSSTTISSISGGSSKRFKNSIQPLVNSEILYALKPVSFYYNTDFCDIHKLRYGFIAEDVLKIDPELVEMEAEDPTLCNAIYYNSIITLAVAEIQKLRKELNELKASL